MALKPSLWRTLPNDLLHLVFACLPVAGISQLRVLSKEWKKNVDCKDSEFNRVFNSTPHFKMFALLSFGRSTDSGNIYDVQTNKCHIYKVGMVNSFMAADEGLVCCVSQYKRRCIEHSQLFIVMNPLTKQKTQLPPLLCMGAQKTNSLMIVLVKLIVDKKTKEYKVFVVSSIANNGRGFFAQVYDSHIKKWTVVEATQGHIIGWDYDYINFGTRCMLNVYNCANGILLRFNETNIIPGLEVEPSCCTLLDDHLFVLHKVASLGPIDLLEDGESIIPTYCISEFHFPEKTIAWTKLRKHSCSPSKYFHDSQHGIINLRLWGCNGFLLVYSDGSEHAWLYNLSTCEWCTLPTFRRPLFLSMMCSISWSAIV